MTKVYQMVAHLLGLAQVRKQAPVRTAITVNTRIVTSGLPEVKLSPNYSDAGENSSGYCRHRIRPSAREIRSNFTTPTAVRSAPTGRDIRLARVLDERRWLMSGPHARLPVGRASWIPLVLSKVLTTTSHLRRHEPVVHPENGKKLPYGCEQCRQPCARKNDPIQLACRYRVDDPLETYNLWKLKELPTWIRVPMTISQRINCNGGPTMDTLANLTVRLRLTKTMLNLKAPAFAATPISPPNFWLSKSLRRNIKTTSINIR